MQFFKNIVQMSIHYCLHPSLLSFLIITYYYYAYFVFDVFINTTSPATFTNNNNNNNAILQLESDLLGDLVSLDGTPLDDFPSFDFQLPSNDM